MLAKPCVSQSRLKAGMFVTGYQPPAAASPWRVEFSRKGEPRRGGGPPGGGRGYSDRGPPPVRGEAK